MKERPLKRLLLQLADYQECERIHKDLALHVRYLHGQSHYVAYESDKDPRWRGTTRRVTVDMKRGGPGGQIIADEDVSNMAEELIYRRLPYSDMYIRVELYYLPSLLHVSETMLKEAAPAVRGQRHQWNVRRSHIDA